MLSNFAMPSVCVCVLKKVVFFWFYRTLCWETCGICAVCALVCMYIRTLPLLGLANVAFGALLAKLMRNRSDGRFYCFIVGILINKNVFESAARLVNPVSRNLIRPTRSNRKPNDPNGEYAVEFFNRCVFFFTHRMYVCMYYDKIL